jgi:hypothetical protein
VRFVIILTILVSLQAAESKQPAIQAQKSVGKSDPAESSPKGRPDSGTNLRAPETAPHTGDGKPDAHTQSNQDIYTVKIASQPSNPTDIWVIISVLISGFVALITFGSLMLSRRQLRIDQRAWIGVEAIAGNMVEGSPYVIQIGLINTGKTPASHVSTVHSAKSLNAGEKISFTHELPATEPTKALLIPHSKYFITMRVTDKATTDYVRDIAAEKYRYAIYGTVIYKDVFKQKHWLTFYYYLRPDGQAYILGPEHNETGDGDPPQEW